MRRGVGAVLEVRAKEHHLSPMAANVPLAIYDAGLHMHTRGKTANTRLIR